MDSKIKCILWNDATLSYANKEHEKHVDLSDVAATPTKLGEDDEERIMSWFKACALFVSVT